MLLHLNSEFTWKESASSMAGLEVHVLLFKDSHAFSYTGIVKNKVIPTAMLLAD